VKKVLKVRKAAPQPILNFLYVRKLIFRTSEITQTVLFFQKDLKPSVFAGFYLNATSRLSGFSYGCGQPSEFFFSSFLIQHAQAGSSDSEGKSP